MTKYNVLVTEFWSLAYPIEAMDPGAALRIYAHLSKYKTLPKPKRKLLGRIEPPEEVWDETGALVYSSYPPHDDAERMLFAEMWARMPQGEARRISLEFVCAVQGWDVSDFEVSDGKKEKAG